MTSLAALAASAATTVAEAIHSPRCEAFLSAVENITDAKPGAFTLSGTSLLDIHREANGYIESGLATCNCAAAVTLVGGWDDVTATVRGTTVTGHTGMEAMVAAHAKYLANQREEAGFWITAVAPALTRCAEHRAYDADNCPVCGTAARIGA